MREKLGRRLGEGAKEQVKSGIKFKACEMNVISKQYT